MKTIIFALLLLCATALLSGCRYYIDAAPRIIIQSDELPVPLDSIPAP